MGTISIRFSDEEVNLIKGYTSANGISVSSFIRDSVLDAVEESLRLDEDRILSSWEQAKEEPRYTFDEMVKELNL